MKDNGANANASIVKHEKDFYRQLRLQRNQSTVFAGKDTRVFKSDDSQPLGHSDALKLELQNDQAKVGAVIDLLQHADLPINAKFDNPAQPSYFGPSLVMNISATLMPIFLQLVRKDLDLEDGVFFTEVAPSNAQAYAGVKSFKPLPKHDGSDDFLDMQTITEAPVAYNDQVARMFEDACLRSGGKKALLLDVTLSGVYCSTRPTIFSKALYAQSKQPRLHVVTKFGKGVTVRFSSKLKLASSAARREDNDSEGRQCYAGVVFNRSDEQPDKKVIIDDDGDFDVSAVDRLFLSEDVWIVIPKDETKWTPHSKSIIGPESLLSKDISLDTGRLNRKQRKARKARIEEVLAAMEYVLGKAGMEDDPIACFGYRMMSRGESFVTDQRVPTHLIVKMGNMIGIDKFVQTCGRATFLRKNLLDDNGWGGKVTTLLTEDDYKLVQAYPDLLKYISDALKNDVKLRDLLKRDSKLNEDGDLPALAPLAATARVFGTKKNGFSKEFLGHSELQRQTHQKSSSCQVKCPRGVLEVVICVLHEKEDGTTWMTHREIEECLRDLVEMEPSKLPQKYVDRLEHLIGQASVASDHEKQAGVHAKIKEAIPNGDLPAHFLYSELAVRNNDRVRNNGRLQRQVRGVVDELLEQTHADLSLFGLEATTKELHKLGGHQKLINCDGVMLTCNQFDKMACEKINRQQSRQWYRNMKIHRVGDDDFSDRGPVLYHDFSGSTRSFEWEYSIAEGMLDADSEEEGGGGQEEDERSEVTETEESDDGEEDEDFSDTGESGASSMDDENSDEGESQEAQTPKRASSTPSDPATSEGARRPTKRRRRFSVADSGSDTDGDDDRDAKRVSKKRPAPMTEKKCTNTSCDAFNRLERVPAATKSCPTCKGKTLEKMLG